MMSLTKQGWPLSRAMRVIPLAVLLLLGACEEGGFTEAVRMTRDAPDEFTVVSRPSLSVPPEFTLRPPRPGEPPRVPTADATARGLVTGRPATMPSDPASLTEPTVDTAVIPVIATTSPSMAALSFLKRAGADKASATIREQLSADVARPVDTSNAKTLLDKVSGEAKAEPVIDAKKEAERLRHNKDNNLPATEGDVQVEKVKPATVLDRIF